MKHVFSTIAFALLLSANQVTAFNGSDLMELSQGNAQVDNKTTQTDAAKAKAAAKAKIEAAKKVQTRKKQPNVLVKPDGGTNDAQLMKDETNADIQGNRGRSQGGLQQQPQQDVDPTQQGTDTTVVDSTTKADVTTVAANTNDSKEDDSKGLLTGNMKMWIIVAVVLLVIIYFATRKKPVDKRHHDEPVKEESSVEQKLITDLRERIAGLEADREELRRQNSNLKIELDHLRSQVANNNNNSSNTQPQNQGNVKVNRKAKSMELYANILNGRVFPADDLQTERDEFTVFVLNVSGDEGAFKVNDAANAQLYLISNFAYSVASAVDVKSKEMSAKSIVTVKPGRVRKTGSGWTIVKNAVVELK